MQDVGTTSIQSMRQEKRLIRGLHGRHALVSSSSSTHHNLRRNKVPSVSDCTSDIAWMMFQKHALRHNRFDLRARSVYHATCASLVCLGHKHRQAPQLCSDVWHCHTVVCKYKNHTGSRPDSVNTTLHTLEHTLVSPNHDDHLRHLFTLHPTSRFTI
jgi:hypothetical protein